MSTENQIENFFDRMVTKEEWESPDFMKFTNAEIPDGEVEFGTRIDAIVHDDLKKSH